LPSISLLIPPRVNPERQHNAADNRGNLGGQSLPRDVCTIFQRQLPFFGCLLWVKSSRSKQIEYYHLSGWYWGKADTRHSDYRGMRAAAFGQKRTLR
jgi:hypothetical protein